MLCTCISTDNDLDKYFQVQPTAFENTLKRDEQYSAIYSIFVNSLSDALDFTFLPHVSKVSGHRFAILENISQQGLVFSVCQHPLARFTPPTKSVVSSSQPIVTILVVSTTDSVSEVRFFSSL
jgi:hypothetical protein